MPEISEIAEEISRPHSHGDRTSHSSNETPSKSSIDMRNWEFHPVGSAERFAIVLSMADGLSSKAQSVFPKHYEVDQNFLSRARQMWRNETQRTGKEVETYIYSQNGKLDLGYSCDVGTPDHAGLKPNSSTSGMFQQRSFLSGGRVIGLAHTHPPEDPPFLANSKIVENVLALFSKIPGLSDSSERFSYGDFLSFIQRNLIKQAIDGTHTVAMVTIEEGGLGLLIATKDTFDRIEAYKKGKMRTADGQKVGFGELRDGLIKEAETKAHTTLNCEKPRQWGMVLYHHLFGTSKWKRVI